MSTIPLAVSLGKDRKMAGVARKVNMPIPPVHKASVMLKRTNHMTLKSPEDTIVYIYGLERELSRRPYFSLYDLRGVQKRDTFSLVEDLPAEAL